MTYDANYQAVQWFLGEVYPRIQSRIPEVHFTVTGDHNNLPLPPARNVTLTGYVQDVRSQAASSAVSIAPLWIGGGTRLKILEAMALGSPVVATSKGAEGLDAKNDAHLLIADTPEDFASAVVRLLSNQEFARQMADRAYELVREKYDWQVILPTFQNALNQAMIGQAT
jgi:glycosyltransferase involved in cell wall biosynthesis